MLLPFFNRYPYTNFEQLNLDHLMNQISTFDSRITNCEVQVEDLSEKVDTFDSRITANADDIADIKPRLTDAENDIDALETTVGDNDSGLVKAVNDINSDIGNITPRVEALETTVGDNDSGLVKAVNDLDSEIDSIPVVVGNPGGSATGTLSKIGIGDTIYNVPSGGGGSGTEVIANPTGTGAADLNKVSIAGIIYDIPETDISALESSVSDLETTVGDNDSGLVKAVNDLESATGFLSSGVLNQVISYFSTTSFPDVILSSDYLTLTPGTWLVFGYCETEVIPSGSAYVSIEHGICDSNGVEIADTHSRIANIMTFFNTTSQGTGPVYADFANSFTTVLTVAQNTDLYMRQEVLMRDGAQAVSAGTQGKISAIKIR